MKLNNKYEIKEIPYGYKMIEQITVKDFKTKKPKKGTAQTFYGTMDQALVGFLNQSIGDPETLDELRAKVVSIRELIVSLRTEIIAERGIIRSVKP